MGFIGKPGRETAVQEKPPIFGMLQRNEEVIIKMLNNVKKGNHQTSDPKSLNLRIDRKRELWIKEQGREEDFR